MIDLGDIYSRGFEVRNASDVLSTPASNVCTLTLPDATTATPTLTVASTGVLRLDYTTVQAGRHTGRLVTTTPDSAHTFSFDVDAGSTGLVSLADAKAHLGSTATTNDEKLRSFIDAATDFIEGRVGPVVRRTIVKTVQPLDGKLFLNGPAVSLTTITAAYGSGGTYTVGDFFLDGDNGVVYPPYGTTTFCRPVTVTYVGGRVIVPAGIRQAALDYIQWMYESQRGATGVPLPGDGDFGMSTTAPTVPFRILQALEPYVVPVVA